MRSADTHLVSAARRAGDTATAVEFFGRISRVDPLHEFAGSSLFAIGGEAIRRGDLEGALAAWTVIRGPDTPKTTAQYGIRLVRKALAYGELPTTFEERPIASLDAATLEQGILTSADVLRRAAVAASAGEAEGPTSEPDAPPLEEVERQQRLFVALCLAYMNQGNNIREFILAHQLIPLVFR